MSRKNNEVKLEEIKPIEAAAAVEEKPVEAIALKSVICPRCKTVVKIKPGHKVACPLCNTTLEA